MQTRTPEECPQAGLWEDPASTWSYRPASRIPAGVIAGLQRILDSLSNPIYLLGSGQPDHTPCCHKLLVPLLQTGLEAFHVLRL